MIQYAPFYEEDDLLVYHVAHWSSRPGGHHWTTAFQRDDHVIGVVEGWLTRDQVISILNLSDSLN